MENCLSKSRCMGLCPKHYQRFLRHGDPTMVKMGGWKQKPIDFSKQGMKLTDKRPYQDTCTLADIFPFLYDEDSKDQFQID